MGHYAVLILPSAELSSKGWLPRCWLMIFDAKDFHDDCYDLLKDENDTAICEKEAHEAGIKFIGANTTVEKAMKLFDKRMALVQSQYLKKLLDHLKPLRYALEISPNAGQIFLSLRDYVDGTYRSDEDALDDLKEMTKELEDALADPDYSRFSAFYSDWLVMTGDYESDKREYEAMDKIGKMKLEDALLNEMLMRNKN